jgi:hypothetical protein
MFLTREGAAAYRGRERVVRRRRGELQHVAPLPALRGVARVIEALRFRRAEARHAAQLRLHRR